MFDPIELNKLGIKTVPANVSKRSDKRGANAVTTNSSSKGTAKSNLPAKPATAKKLTVNDMYDLGTKDGVKAFQKAHGLKVDGEIGPQTRKMAAYVGYTNLDADDVVQKPATRVDAKAVSKASDSNSGTAFNKPVKQAPNVTQPVISKDEVDALAKLGVGVPSDQTFEPARELQPRLGLADTVVAQQNVPSADEIAMNNANKHWGTYERNDGTPQQAYYYKDGDKGTVVFNPTNLDYDTAKLFGLAYEYSK